MHHPRNVRDAVPSRLSRTRITEFADKVSRELGYRPGEPLLPIFEKLGGTYHNVASTFGRYGDRVFVDSMGSFAYEGEEWPDHDVSGIAEAIGAYVINYPVTRRKYGDDVRMGLTRYGGDEDRNLVVAETIWFGIALTMPGTEFREAVESGMDLRQLADRFRVSRRCVLSRKKSLGLAPQDPG